MNIHTEIQHLENLKQRTIFKTVIGSRLYDTAHEHSDTDILYVYIESLDELNNPFFNHHQFQIKKDGVDHIFTSLRQFSRNLLLGDSSINLDVLILTNIDNIIPPFAAIKKEVMTSYPILKCLLGLAKRDLKLATHTKKINHAKRGLACFEQLRKKGFFTKKDIQTALNTPISKEALQEKQRQLRFQLNEDYNQGKLSKYISTESQQVMIQYLVQQKRLADSPLLQQQLAANNTKEFKY